MIARLASRRSQKLLQGSFNNSRARISLLLPARPLSSLSSTGDATNRDWILAVVPILLSVGTLSYVSLEEEANLLNWSGTHSVNTSNYWEPTSIEQVETIVADCHSKGQPVRPVGSALSPNGIAFHPGGMMSLANLDQVVEITESTVTVQAGARISQVVDALRPHGYTLPNLASIAEQQMGGFVQVGAHGTGRCIAPVDEYVTKLKIVTPALGTLTLHRDSEDPQEREMFYMTRVGLGCFGVVVEVTMETIPAHKLVEQTFVLTRDEAYARIDELLKEHKHMRYMWIPYADAVVVVTNDPAGSISAPKMSPPCANPLKPMTGLLMELSKDSSQPYTDESLKTMGFGEVRDALLSFNPLNVEHVKRCNQAEAEFWRQSQGYRVRPSDELLQFDCGGQQWVLEQCFPTGTLEDNNGNDMEFLRQLLKEIETQRIPAHTPIEQRWSASSSSPMSPAHGNGLFSWVGIINYLPSEDPDQRHKITESFTGRYCEMMRRVGQPMGAVTHWAKIEQPKSMAQLELAKSALQERYPVERFNALRKRLDPKGILSSAHIDVLFGQE